MANVGNRQGRDGDESRQASVDCLRGLAIWATAPFRWMRSLNVGDWLAIVILVNVVCAMVWGK